MIIELKKIDEKRVRYPGLSGFCDKCRSFTDKDPDPYLSYPEVGKTVLISTYCPTCDDWQSNEYMVKGINVMLEPVKE